MSRQFRDDICKYNSALSFVCFGADIIFTSGHGPPVFIVHGAVYHRCSAVPPHPGEEPQFAQLYIYDHAVALAHQTTHWRDLNPDLLHELSQILERSNVYAKTMKFMGDVVREHHLTQADTPTFSSGFASSSRQDVKRYSAPTVGDVAAVFVGQDGMPPMKCDIIVYPRTEVVFRVDERHHAVMPMTYALLFPFGDPGWHIDMQHKAQVQTEVRTRVSNHEFYTYHDMMSDISNLLSHGAGMLFQQWLVESYCMMAESRLHHVRQNQETLRASSCIFFVKPSNLLVPVVLISHV